MLAEALRERAGDGEPAAARPKFGGQPHFQAELKRRVGQYFEQTGQSPYGGRRMVVKTAIVLAWFLASYLVLVFVAQTWWQGLLLSASLAFAMGGIGFSIQHDANHGAYSQRRWVNRLAGLTLDLLGASSYLWQWQHNVFHHTYPNLSGADNDIDFLPFARLSPAQPYYRWHRFQQFYLWILYGFLYPKWNFIDDFKNVAKGRIVQSRFPRPRGWRLVEAIAGKLVFFSWAFLVPMLFHRWWIVLAFYATTAYMLGVLLAVVFQLAHCVEDAEFPDVSPVTHRIPRAWAVHQVNTSVDFAQTNRVLTWYLGGLNFQIEHHLFPKISHLHYPRLSGIVRAVCAEFGVRYAVHENLGAAVSSHWRWLRRMGAPAAVHGAS